MSTERFAKFRLVDSVIDELLAVANDLAAYAAQATAGDSIEASSEVKLCQHGISLLASRAATLASRQAGSLEDQGSAKAEAAYNAIYATQQTLVALCEAAREEAIVNAQNAAAAEEHRKHFPSLGQNTGTSAATAAPRPPPYEEQVPFPADLTDSDACEAAGRDAVDDGSKIGIDRSNRGVLEAEATDASDLLLGTSPSGERTGACQIGRGGV